MPTPAPLATASRLASGPPALNTALAVSSRRSRLRSASARGFRDVSESSAFLFKVFIQRLLGQSFFVCRFLGTGLTPVGTIHPLKSGGVLRISQKRSLPPYPAEQQPAQERRQDIAF